MTPYDGFGAPIYEWATPAAECDTCGDSPTGLCPGCCWECTDTWCPEHLAEGREDGAVDEERARWEEGEI